MPPAAAGLYCGHDDPRRAGPDIARGIFPVVAVTDISGVRMIDEATLNSYANTIVQARQRRPDGPMVPMEDVR